MKLICIYGPPAAGKLTVARELSAITGIKLFHNHVTIDFAEELFGWGTPAFRSVVDNTRMLVFQEAAKADIDLIFTFVYLPPADDAYIEQMVRIVEDQGGEVCFVRLQCPAETLEQRIVLPDRKQFNKMSSVEGLHKLMARGDLTAGVPQGGFDINSCRTNPSEAAMAIAKHYTLRKEGDEG